MKVVVSGATGFIGGEILRQCLRSSAVTTVVALARRDISPDSVPGSEDMTDDQKRKLKTLVVGDWLHYSDAELRELEGAQACFWALGAFVQKNGIEQSRKVEVGYPLAAARTFARLSAATAAAASPDHKIDDDEIDRRRRRRFRFVYVSGVLSERDQDRSLWFAQGPRKIKGVSENELADLVHENASAIEAHVVRPAYVYSRRPVASFVTLPLLRFLAAANMAVGVDELAAAMLGLGGVYDDHQQQQQQQQSKSVTLQNADLIREGRTRLATAR